MSKTMQTIPIDIFENKKTTLSEVSKIQKNRFRDTLCSVSQLFLKNSNGQTLYWESRDRSS